MEESSLFDSSQSDSFKIAQNIGSENNLDESPSINPLLEIESNFDKYDTDNSGYLNELELVAITESKESSQELKRVAGLLSRDVSYVEEYSNDEWFDERSGISKADLAKFRTSDFPMTNGGLGDWLDRKFAAAPRGYGLGVISMADPLSWGESKVPTRVIHVARGSAAEYAGLKADDLIEKIDGKDVTSMTHEQVQALLKGDRKTNIDLTVSRNGAKKQFTIRRQKISDIKPPRTEYGISQEDDSSGNKSEEGTNCKPNTEYFRIIREASRKHYDPFSLGDLSELTNKHNCEIKTKEEAHNKAQSELRSLTNDKYTTVKDLEAEAEQEAAVPGNTDPDIDEKDLGDGIAYIKLHDFSDKHDVEKMEEALEKHKNANALVLDLRGNPGGLFNVALDITSMLVPEGNIVQTHNRLASDPNNPKYESKVYSLTGRNLVTRTTSLSGVESVQRERRQEYMLDGKPVVLLVNRQSSSASEIVAGALKDNDAAILIGKTTYGKGIGQSTYDVSSEHSLKMTTFRFASPDGTWPGDARGKRYGIKPDKDVYSPSWAVKGSERDLQLKAAIEEINKMLGR